MFSVYVEDKNGQNETCIFHDVSIDLALKLVSPTLELEDNSAGSFQFTMYSSNQGYGLIPDTTTDRVSILTSTIRIYREWTKLGAVSTDPPTWFKEEIWEGRPLSEEKDFYNGRVIYCEGAFSYLNDVNQPIKEYLGPEDETTNTVGDIELIDYVNGVLNEYNKHAAPNRRFDTSKTYVNPVGISSLCTLKDPVPSVDQLPTGEGSGTKDYDIRKVGDDASKTYYMYTTLTGWKDVSKSVYHTMGSYYKTGGESTKDAISVLVSSFGGHVKVVTVGNDKARVLYYTANADPEDAYLYPQGSASVEDRGEMQDVAFGKNLLDISRKRDGSNFFTVLLPVGAEIGSTPETVTSMCPNIIEDGTKIATLYAHSDIIKSDEVAPYDSVSQYSVEARTNPNTGETIARKVIAIDLEQAYNGYDFFLNTTSFYRAESPTDWDKNTYFYRLSDRSAEVSKISIIGDVNGEGMNYTPVGGPVTWGCPGYANHRLITMKSLSRNNGARQTLTCERIQIPFQGIYTFIFSVGDVYAWIADRENDNIRTIMDDNLNWRNGVPDPVTGELKYFNLMYPNFYRSPYKRENYIQSGVRKIPKERIRWHGTHPRDNHERNAITTPPYNQYGLDDCDVVMGGPVPGAVYVSDGNLRGSAFLDRFFPFYVNPEFREQYGNGIPVPTDWQNAGGGTNTDLLFTTDYTGHHVGKICVEPGRTYYLTTRVTNKGFPNIPSDPDLWGNPNYAVFNDDGSIKAKSTRAIYAYVIVAYKFNKDGSKQWFEPIMYKEANQSDITTDLFMEEIKVPEAVFPERYVSEDEQGWEGKQRFELWFTCDQCYINGCANLDPTQGEVGYEPELYILDKDVEPSSQDKNDYQDKVTVAPLQRPATQANYGGKDPSQDNPAYTDNYGFPYEYIVNREMYEKYGPIVKRSEYSNATTPEKLMEYANIEMLSMQEDPSFEVSAADLKACGISDCDTFRLLQKIKIETEPHGIDQRATLTKISMDLADLSSNTYTFGYEPTSNLSQMQNGDES